jgi:hypothetical protein
MSTEIVMAQAPSTAPPFAGLHGPESLPSSGTDGSNAIEAKTGRRKANLRYQHGYLYENHGAWFVRYRQRDEAGNVVYTAKHLGCCKDFFDIAAVEQCRAQFMQTIDRERLNANSRMTLAIFVEVAYLPWTKEERRASTSRATTKSGATIFASASATFEYENFEPWMRIDCCARLLEKGTSPELRCNTSNRF